LCARKAAAGSGRIGLAMQGRRPQAGPPIRNLKSWILKTCDLQSGFCDPQSAIRKSAICNLECVI
jgi:hypothetical protein